VGSSIAGENTKQSRGHHTRLCLRCPHFRGLSVRRGEELRAVAADPSPEGGARVVGGSRRRNENALYFVPGGIATRDIRPGTEGVLAGGGGRKSGHRPGGRDGG